MTDRKKKITSDDTAARVRHIRGLMSTSSWNPSTRAELAEKWGISVHRCSELGAQASRSLRFDDPDEIEQQRASLIATIQTIQQRALNDRNLHTGQLDLDAAIEATNLLARYLGLAPLDSEPVQAPVRIVVTSEVARAWLQPNDDRVCERCKGSGMEPTDPHVRLLPPGDDDNGGPPPTH